MVGWPTPTGTPCPALPQTPVNNWRIILSKVLGRDIALIDDERSVLFRDEDNIYDTRDVTAAFGVRDDKASGLRAAIE